METFYNGTKGRASFGWDLRVPKFYAIVLLAGKALHTPLINGFCKAFVKEEKLQALQDCCPGLEATIQPDSGPSRACCQQQIHNFISTHSGSGFWLQWVSLGSFMLLCLSSYLQLLSQSQKIFGAVFYVLTSLN